MQFLVPSDRRGRGAAATLVDARDPGESRIAPGQRDAARPLAEKVAPGRQRRPTGHRAGTCHTSRTAAVAWPEATELHRRRVEQDQQGQGPGDPPLDLARVNRLCRSVYTGRESMKTCTAAIVPSRRTMTSGPVQHGAPRSSRSGVQSHTTRQRGQCRRASTSRHPHGAPAHDPPAPAVRARQFG